MISHVGTAEMGGIALVTSLVFADQEILDSVIRSAWRINVRTGTHAKNLGPLVVLKYPFVYRT